MNTDIHRFKNMISKIKYLNQKPAMICEALCTKKCPNLLDLS